MPSLVNLIQVETLEEKMSHLRGELAAKEEHLTQVSICPIAACINRNKPVKDREDVMMISIKLYLIYFLPLKSELIFYH